MSKGLVRFSFRHFAFIGDESSWAAEASECANEQNRFWDYYNKLFEEQAGESVGTFGRENLKRFAAELSLDTMQFNQCLDSGKYSAKVRRLFGISQEKATYGGTPIRQIGDNPQDQGKGVRIKSQPEGCHNSAA